MYGFIGVKLRAASVPPIAYRVTRAPPLRPSTHALQHWQKVNMAYFKAVYILTLCVFVLYQERIELKFCPDSGEMDHSAPPPPLMRPPEVIHGFRR